MPWGAASYGAAGQPPPPLHLTPGVGWLGDRGLEAMGKATVPMTWVGPDLVVSRSCTNIISPAL